MIRRIIILLVVFMAIVYGFRGILLPPVAHFLNVSEPRLPIGYAAILPGSNETRTFAVAALVRNGLAQKAIILKNIDTPLVADGHAIPSHELSRRILLKRGVREDQILEFSGKSSTTMTDAKILSQLWELDPEAEVAIVSNDYHLRRARWTFYQIVPEHYDRMCFIAAPDDQFEFDRWWTSLRGAQSVGSEYLKLAAYAYLWADPAERVGAGLIALLFCYLLYRALRPTPLDHGTDREALRNESRPKPNTA